MSCVEFYIKEETMEQLLQEGLLREQIQQMDLTYLVNSFQTIPSQETHEENTSSSLSDYTSFVLREVKFKRVRSKERPEDAMIHKFSFRQDTH